MIDDGFYFGGHTMTHPPLNQLTHEEQKKEIINSINWLKENSSTPVTDIPLFAKNMEMREGEYFITLEDGNILRAKKV